MMNRQLIAAAISFRFRETTEIEPFRESKVYILDGFGQSKVYFCFFIFHTQPKWQTLSDPNSIGPSTYLPIGENIKTTD